MLGGIRLGFLLLVFSFDFFHNFMVNHFFDKTRYCITFLVVCQIIYPILYLSWLVLYPHPTIYDRWITPSTSHYKGYMYIYIYIRLHPMVQYLISYTFIYTRHWWLIYSKKKYNYHISTFIYNILYPSLMVNMPVKDHSLWIPGSPLSDKTGDCFCRPSTFSGIRKGRSRASKSCVDFFDVALRETWGCLR